MDRNKINALLCAIITTLDEATNPEEMVGEGVIYAALMNEVALAEFSFLIGLAAEGGLVQKHAGHGLTITASGRKMAKQISAFAAHRATAEKKEEGK